MVGGYDNGWQPEAPPLQGRGLGWGLSQPQIDWLHQRAREMRSNPTEPEKLLWRNLSNSQLEGLKFRRQEVIGPYIADFMCPARSLIVEVDGDTHDEVKDRLRDGELADFGFHVLRVTNEEVMRNMDGVLQAIGLAAEGRVSRHMPHPNPSPEGEGLECRAPLRGAPYEEM
ncbi:MAG: endonuclease domain-containing protein [Sphingomonadaceae bacterium]|nr:endonuclease domain-containing protein [Sphingomonadaceae bacterium]